MTLPARSTKQQFDRHPALRFARLGKVELHGECEGKKALPTSGGYFSFDQCIQHVRRIAVAAITIVQLAPLHHEDGRQPQGTGNEIAGDKQKVRLVTLCL